jgi:hypothetical protein
MGGICPLGMGEMRKLPISSTESSEKLQRYLVYRTDGSADVPTSGQTEPEALN